MTLRGALPRTPSAPLLATALLLALAYPPFHLLVPSLVALVPLGTWVARLPAGTPGRREALRGGFFAGLVFFTLLLHWLAVALVPYSLLAVPAFLATVVVLSGLLGVAVVGMHAAVARLDWPVWLALPVFWTAMEWLRAHLGDLSFPWMQLGDSLTGWPRLIGAADLVGSRGLSFWLALVNGLLAEAALRWRPALLDRWLPPAGRPAPSAEAALEPVPPPRDAEAGADGGPGDHDDGAGSPAWRPAVAALLALAVPVAYSLHRWKTLEPTPAARVAVIQPNVPQELKLAPSTAADSARASVARLAERRLATERGGLDLVALPETVVPAVVGPAPGHARPGRADPDRWIVGLADRLDAPVLYGARGARTAPDGGGTDRFNSAFLRGPEGRWLGRYAKRRLVPGVETTPFLDASWLRRSLAGLLGARYAGLTPGPEPRLLRAGGARFGVLICYESVFADLSRAYRRRGADFLVNVTNDAWFGREEPPWVRTSGLWQHPAHLVMRAVETRSGIVRSANTGISAVVDPLGRTVRRTELFEAAALAAPVLTTEGSTPYIEWGDVLGRLAAVVAAGAVVAAALRPVRGAGP